MFSLAVCYVEEACRPVALGRQKLLLRHLDHGGGDQGLE